MTLLLEVRRSASHVVLPGPDDDDGDDAGPGHGMMSALPPGPHDDDGNGIAHVRPVGPDDDDGGIIGSLPPGPDDDDGTDKWRHSVSYDGDDDEGLGAGPYDDDGEEGGA